MKSQQYSYTANQKCLSFYLDKQSIVFRCFFPVVRILEQVNCLFEYIKSGNLQNIQATTTDASLYVQEVFLYAFNCFGDSQIRHPTTRSYSTKQPPPTHSFSIPLKVSRAPPHLGFSLTKTLTVRCDPRGATVSIKLTKKAHGIYRKYRNLVAMSVLRAKHVRGFMRSVDDTSQLAGIKMISLLLITE